MSEAVKCPHCSGYVTVREDRSEDIAILHGFLMWALNHPIDDDEDP